MVAVFASLKWRLVTSRFRSAHGARRAWTIVGLCSSLVFVALIVFSLVALRVVPGGPQDPVLIVVGLFTAQLIAWMLTPLIAFGIDETVDPQRFALLPIRRATLQRGLLVSSLIGYFPLANALVLLGAAVAMSARWSVLPLALVCAAVQLVTCVVFSRAAATSMAALMSSRRGRDIGVFVGFLIFVLYMLLAFVTNSGSGATAVGAGVGSTARALRYSPPGSLAMLPDLVAAGQWGRASIAVLTPAVFLAFGLWWWRTALQRALTTPPSATTGSSPAGRGPWGRNRSIADGLPGTVRLVASRDALLAWRDPMRRLPWLMVFVIALGWPFLVVHGHGSLFAVVFGAVMVGAQAGNQLSIEGSGLWLHLVAFGDRTRSRGEIFGHAIAALVPGLVIISVSLVVHAMVRDDYPMLPAAAGVCLAGMLGAVGTACWVSTVLPYPMPQSRKSLFASSITGYKGRSAGASLALLGGGLVTAVPAGVLAALSLWLDPVWGWVALVVGAASGVAVLAWLASVAADRYRARGPEILAVVAAGDRA